jgi:hypothetical protein
VSAPADARTSLAPSGEIAAQRASGRLWSDVIAANEPGELCPANEPMNKQRHGLTFEIVPLAQGDHERAACAFWKLLGDLVADVIIDGVDGPWGSAPPSNEEILAA